MRCSKNRPVDRLPWIMTTGTPSAGPDSMYRMRKRFVCAVCEVTPDGRFIDVRIVLDQPPSLRLRRLRQGGDPLFRGEASADRGQHQGELAAGAGIGVDGDIAA